MSKTAEFTVTLDARRLYDLAETFWGLAIPKPAYADDCYVHLTAKECRKYVELGNKIAVNSHRFDRQLSLQQVELIYAARLIESELSSYLYKAVCDANALSLTGKERLCFLRQKSKEFRLTFC